ncbi:hypothetical protein B0H17DRAFT_954737 [Mycena rosella]|uniref:TEA domain-containing protein n=1 Tax=Mycena rosella TaxID=1033263 RepID=A0AAD7G632_MYCRO|nr:hypothetical protein B0H17DRAFT_954737 [Mycena rosella]
MEIGLEIFVPDDSAETRVLGRCRGRNQFIAEYIFSKTGEQRSRKQVGSRLQQLRSDPKRQFKTSSLICFVP